jgi:hypothetical protein
MVSIRSRRAGITVRIALVFAVIIVFCFSVARSQGQDKKVYQAGTIVDVQPHQAAAGSDSDKKQFDVSIKVANKIYVVLYSPPGGQDFAEYGVGMNRTVLVEGDTMKLNDLLGRTRILPVLSVKDAPSKSPQ